MLNPLSNLNLMVSSAAGVGTISAMHKASSPKSILQYIVNFLTLGGVRRDNEKEYQVLVQFMADELSKTGYNRGGEFPEKIVMDDFNGYKVVFSLSVSNSSSKQVIIEVSKDNLSESAEVPFGTFEKVCKTLMFRREFSIPQHGIVLTEEGGMYLKDANLSGVKLIQEDLSYADLSNAIMDEKSNMFMTNLSYADLKGCRLFNVPMYKTNLSGACLEHAVLFGVEMNNCEAVGANVKYASLTGSSIFKCNLTRADMRNSTLLACDISDSNLEYCDLSGANMLGAKLNGDNLTGVKLKNTNLDNSTLTNLILEDVDLTKTQLENCTSSNLLLEGSIISKAANLSLNGFYSETHQITEPLLKDTEVR